MSCFNKECRMYDIEYCNNCEELNEKFAKEFCKHYKEPVSDLRIKCNRANRHVIDGSQEVFNNAIVDAIEKLQK